MKLSLLACLASLALLSPVVASAETAPHTIVHVITVKWKDGTTPAQVDAALQGAIEMPAKYPGVLHTWTKTLKAQGGKANAIVMEFSDAAAFKAYTDSPAQKDWYKVYLPIRGESTTFDITN